MNQQHNIAIIGAGPSGLMAAETLAQAGCHVTIYDHMPTPARKFLIAGRGGLNLTHSEPLEQFLTRYEDAEDWLTPMVHAFPPAALKQWCESLGEETFVGSSGRIFPKSMKAAPLLRAWLKRLESLGVHYAPRHTWHGWHGNALYFTTAEQENKLVAPDATLLALGGASWPRLGSNGNWVSLLTAHNVSIAPFRAANCGFTSPWSEHFITRFAGTPVKPVTITHNGISRQGEAMITAQGIEGGVIYALSANIRKAIERDGKTSLTLDMRPNVPIEALAKKFRQTPRASKSFSTYMSKLGFSPLVTNLLREVIPSDALTHASPEQLAASIKNLPIILTGTSSIARAISSAGGIEKSAINRDLMLLNKPGVFVAGEMLDWEAPTGGYLLQACFSTAVAAAQGILRYCQPEARTVW